jgi:exonuclease SbcD
VKVDETLIKVVHFADLHLGVENYGRTDPTTGLSSRLTDFLRSFDQVVEYALDEANAVDLVVFAGDAFRTRDPSPTYQRAFARRMRRLSEGGLPVVLIAGNHDLPTAANRAHAVEIFDTLSVSHVHVSSAPEWFRIETDSGPVQVVTLPWVTRSSLLARDEYKNRSLEEINELIVERLIQIVEGEGGLIGQLDRAVPTLLVAHGTVQGAVYGSERSVMLGNDVLLPPSLVRHPSWDYVALGHIHKHQVLHESPPVVYAGSLERIDFGEEKEAKGFVVAEVERGNARYEFHPVDARSLVTVRVKANGDDPTAQVLAAIADHDVTDAVVRVIVHMAADKEPLLRVGEVRRALAGAFYVAAVIKDVDRPARLRLGQEALVAELTPLEVLERYFEVKQTPSERVQLLLDHARALLAEADQGQT